MDNELNSRLYARLMFHNPQEQLFNLFTDIQKDEMLYEGKPLFIKQETKLKEGDTLTSMHGLVFQVIRQAQTYKLFLLNINHNTLCNYDLTTLDTLEKLNAYAKENCCDTLYMANE